MKSQKKKNAILYFLTIIFWGIFYYFLPLAGDDWAWGSSLGIERMKNAFDGYNGRYLGNLLIILITRSVIAKLIVCSLTMFLLILILSKIFDAMSNHDKHTASYLLAFSSVLFLILPNQIAFGELQPFQIFGSTIGWLSGFTNYVVPSVLILLYYYFVTNRGYDNRRMYALLFVDGVSACLCVEHYTLFCLLFSFFIIVYRLYFYKNLCKKSVFFFSGSFVGALIMFSNSSYRLMQEGDVSNNQRAVGFLGSFKQYANYVFGANANKTIVIIFEIVLLLVIASTLAFFFAKLYKALKQKNISKLLPIICIVVMTLPLLFTNSGKEIYIVAPRCYFLQYFMLVIYVYSKFKDKNITSKKFHNGLKICFALLIIVTGILYGQLDYFGAVRDNLVNEAIYKGASTVEVIEYPKSIEHIQWSSNFIIKDTYLNRYKNFKQIPENSTTKIKTLN